MPDGGFIAFIAKCGIRKYKGKYEALLLSSVEFYRPAELDKT